VEQGLALLAAPLLHFQVDRQDDCYSLADQVDLHVFFVLLA
jgi:hypothetical protein